MKKIKKEISCGVIPVYVKENGEKEFFLVLQNNNDWSFPKGHVEEGESFLETAERELFEETGFRCQKILSEKIFTQNYTKEYDNEILDKTVHLFIGFLDKKENPVLQKEEIKDACWCSSDEVLKKLRFKEAKDLFKEALNNF